MSDPNDTFEDFIRERAKWISVFPAQTQDGGWAIVVTIDGNYFDKDMAHEMADYWRVRLGDMMLRLV